MCFYQRRYSSFNMTSDTSMLELILAHTSSMRRGARARVPTSYALNGEGILTFRWRECPWWWHRVAKSNQVDARILRPLSKLCSKGYNHLPNPTNASALSHRIIHTSRFVALLSQRTLLPQMWEHMIQPACSSVLPFRVLRILFT